MTTLRVLRGATFRRDATRRNTDLTGYTITSQVRDPRNLAIVVASATVTIANQVTNEGEFELDFGSTEDWPVGPLWLDIRFDSGGTVDYTNRITIEAVETSTRPV